MAVKFSYSPEMAEAICAALVERGEDGRPRTVADISRMPDMPGESTIYYWLNAHEGFRKHYQIARQIQAEMHFNDLLAELKDIDNTNHMAKRVKIDTIKFVAGKLLPHLYGERSQVEVTGKDGGPIQLERKMGDLEVARWLAFVFHRAERQLKQEEAPASPAPAPKAIARADSRTEDLPHE